MSRDSSSSAQAVGPAGVGLPDPVPVTLIRPLEATRGVDWDELWRYRDLLRFLVLRDVKVRYQQTFLGIAWALLVPLTQMAIFGLIFGLVAKLPSDGLNPFVFYLAALVPWQYFANALGTSSTCLATYSHLLTKIYFPRLYIPVAICIAGLLDFAIAFSMLLVVMLGMQILPPAAVLLVPALLVITFTTALGAGLLFSSIHVKYRDVKFVVPFLIQIWMYGTVVLPFSQLPERWGSWRYLYGLNPMAGVVESFRWCLLHPRMDAVEPPWRLLLVGAPVSILLLLVGLKRFRRSEREFADVA
jgi:lipopolysaccharide transport system permease protein